MDGVSTVGVREARRRQKKMRNRIVATMMKAVPPTAPPMIEGNVDPFFDDATVVIVEIAEGTEVIECRVIGLVFWVVLEEADIEREVAIYSTVVYTA